MYCKVIKIKGGTPPHKERRPYFTFTKKYEKTNAVHRNILSVMFYESSCLLFVH